MNFRDLFEGKEREEFDEWAHHQREVTLKGMAQSATVISMYDTEFSIDYALQVGAMILMDKPILVMIAPGVEIPPKLRLVADDVIEVDPDVIDNQLHPDAPALRDRIMAFMEKHVKKDSDP